MFSRQLIPKILDHYYLTSFSMQYLVPAPVLWPNNNWNLQVTCKRLLIKGIASVLAKCFLSNKYSLPKKYEMFVSYDNNKKTSCISLTHFETANLRFVCLGVLFLNFPFFFFIFYTVNVISILLFLNIIINFLS